VIAAQTGFSGGVIVEDYAVIGGQVGVGDKARIESRAVLGSGSGVLTSKIVRAGQVMWGTPAGPCASTWNSSPCSPACPRRNPRATATPDPIALHASACGGELHFAVFSFTEPRP